MASYDTNLASEFYVLSALYRLGMDASLTLKVALQRHHLRGIAQVTGEPQIRPNALEVVRAKVFTPVGVEMVGLAKRAPLTIELVCTLARIF